MNERRLVVSDSARRDIERQARALARVSMRASHRFVKNVGITIQSIIEQLGLRSPWDDSDEAGIQLRYQLVRRYPRYLIFYSTQVDSVTLVRSFHFSQDIQSELESDSDDD